ncbi:MAG: type II secretion system F family protein [Candidatus Omnitrophica bacterium]|nr:type II secretion system F family protein [Candidatus Omnitrophota bacterium]
MPKYEYKAKQGPHKIVTGLVDAQSEQAAIAQIAKLGLVPLDIHLMKAVKANVPSKSKGFSFSKKVKKHELVLFARQISDLVDASVPMLRSLQIVANQTKNPVFKKYIQSMYETVRDGGSLSNAVSQFPELFPRMMINMIRAGEMSGQLEVVLRRVADHLEREHETQNKVRASLAYPALILVVGLLTMFVLLTFVIPRITVMFDDLDQALPLPTLILTHISSVFSHFWWVMVLAAAGGGFYFRQWVSTEKGRYQFDRLKLQVPLFGKFVTIVEIGRFSRTFGTLVQSGVTLSSALQAVSSMVENVVLRSEILEMTQAVINGSSLRSVLEKSRLFPEMAVNMISIGEETGRLDVGLFKLADVYEKEAEQTMKTLISLLGPVVLIGVVMLVGFVVIAMMLPIVQMNLIIQ